MRRSTRPVPCRGHAGCGSRSGPPPGCRRRNRCPGTLRRYGLCRAVPGPDDVRSRYQAHLPVELGGERVAGHLGAVAHTGEPAPKRWRARRWGTHTRNVRTDPQQFENTPRCDSTRPPTDKPPPRRLRPGPYSRRIEISLPWMMLAAISATSKSPEVSAARSWRAQDAAGGRASAHHLSLGTRPDLRPGRPPRWRTAPTTGSRPDRPLSPKVELVFQHLGEFADRRGVVTPIAATMSPTPRPCVPPRAPAAARLHRTTTASPGRRGSRRTRRSRPGVARQSTLNMSR